MTKDEAIRDAFKTFGSSEPQIADAVMLLPIRVRETGGRFFYNDVPLDNLTAFKEAMQKEKPHLLPRAFSSTTADKAFIEGNLSARATLIRDVGLEEANKIAKLYGLSDVGDARRARGSDDAMKRNGDNNPWRLPEGHPHKADLIEAKIKAIGTKACTGLARAAGSQINGRPLQ